MLFSKRCAAGLDIPASCKYNGLSPIVIFLRSYHTMKAVLGLTDTSSDLFLMEASRLPSFSDGPESIGKDREFGEHRGEPFDQRQQSHLRHGGDQFVEHAALPE